MQDLIKDIISALENVEERFYKLADISFDDGDMKNNENFKTLELRFMQAFSIKFSQEMGNKNIYKKVNYDFEVPKKFMWSNNPDLDIRTTWERLNSKSSTDMIKYFTTVPDFLVHNSQNTMSEENQQIIIEAKTNPNTSKSEVYKDIFHTFIYSNKYNFKCSIILLVNINKSKWFKDLNSYILENYYQGDTENFKKIFVIFKPSYEKPSEVYSIYDILHTINQQCPICNSDMIPRVAKQGINMGKEFLGCSEYPRCNGRRNII